MLKLTGGASVIGVDIEIRAHNRSAIEAHELAGLIHLIEADSAAPATVERVRSLIEPGQSVLVVLDSCHTKSHVAAELEAYHALVTPGSYIVATDGLMRDLHDVPGGESAWRDDHPAAAAAEFARTHPRFRLEQPPRTFNESELTANITYWPDAYLRHLPD
jgi:cephalosporin hydroxylase